MRLLLLLLLTACLPLPTVTATRGTDSKAVPSPASSPTAVAESTLCVLADLLTVRDQPAETGAVLYYVKRGQVVIEYDTIFTQRGIWARIGPSAFAAVVDADGRRLMGACNADSRRLPHST